jgi:restriction system protein
MISKYDEMMLPFLKYLSDGKEHGLNEIREAVASTFELTYDELRELLPSGKQTVFRNRDGWAGTYL